MPFFYNSLGQSFITFITSVNLIELLSWKMKFTEVFRCKINEESDSKISLNFEDEDSCLERIRSLFRYGHPNILSICSQKERIRGAIPSVSTSVP
jgi:hypothetical protein